MQEIVKKNNTSDTWLMRASRAVKLREVLLSGCPSHFFILFPWKLTCEFSTVIYIHYSSLSQAETSQMCCCAATPRNTRRQAACYCCSRHQTRVRQRSIPFCAFSCLRSRYSAPPHIFPQIKLSVFFKVETKKKMFLTFKMCFLFKFDKNLIKAWSYYGKRMIL